VQALSSRGCMKAVSVGNAMWIDVDTPMAHTFAEQCLARYGSALQATARPSMVASAG
jgi:hypothetical protein